MYQYVTSAAIAVAFSLSTLAAADVTVDYTVDAGGNNPNGPSGLSASATFSTSGSVLSIVLSNTSIGAPGDAQVADTLLVSVGFNLDGLSILTGDSALIGTGAIGIGAWDGLVAGDSVGSEWLWTNGGGSDGLVPYSQVISTSSGVPGSGHLDFTGNLADVGGPFGGIVSSADFIAFPDSQKGVQDSIEFTITLDGSLSDGALNALAQSSLVEFGSDYQYMTVPAPGVAAVMLLAGVAGRRRRRD